MYHHGINNNKMIPASVKSKRFWKRKNRSRSPSRSVGRSEVSECFTSSEDEISSISIDDISSDLIESELSENLVGEIDRDFELEIGENENILQLSNFCAKFLYYSYQLLLTKGYLINPM